MPKRRPVQNNTTPSRRLRGGVTKPIAAQAQAQAQQGSRTHQTTMHQFGATGADGTADARKNTRKGGAAGAGAGTSGEQAIKLAGVGANTPMKTFHSPRKEEEQRRQMEADFIQAFRKRHTLRQKLGDVEKQILDLEKHYFREFSTSVGNAIQGYNFDFLAEKPNSTEKKEELEIVTAKPIDGAMTENVSPSIFVFSKSSTTSPVNEVLPPRQLPPKCSPNKK